MTTHSKLAPHVVPEHMDFNGIAEWSPRSIKLVGFDNERSRRAYECNPQALFVLRDWPLSEQHSDMMLRPEETGRRHATEMRQNVEAGKGPIPLDQIVVVGINEPGVWQNNLATTTTQMNVSYNQEAVANNMRTAGMTAMRKRDALTKTRPSYKSVAHLASVTTTTIGVDRTVRYTVAFLDTLTSFGMKGGALNLSVGWPADLGYKDSPVDWSPYEPVHAAIVRGGHYLVLHEYWDPVTGPADMWRWWAGRYLQCPWNVPIIMGECGGDRYVRDGGVGTDSRGWANNVTREEYVSQLAWYDAQLLKDPRIVAALVFLFDFANPWGTFDIRPALSQILTYVRGVQPVEMESLVLKLTTEFGTSFHDIRSELAQHPTLRYANRAPETITQWILHHTTGDPNVIGWQGIANYHVNDPDHNWPGIGYHIGVNPDGSVWYLTSDTKITYHAGAANGSSLAVACLGNYETQPVPPAMQTTLARLRKVLALPVIGHKEVPNETACPGHFLLQWLHPTETKALPEDEIWDPTSGMLYVVFLAQKARWWFEKYTRCIELGNPEYDPEYGKLILYSLINHEVGLLYKLERLLTGASIVSPEEE